VSTISVDYDVLNQRGSPAWFSDTFANIPTAGFKGRMFISTDTFAFYRDTGTGWDLIGGPGIGTLTGSGVAGQVSFFSGTQVLAGNNNLFWDNVNSRLGINTTTPGQPLDIHSTGNTLVQLNNTSTGNSNISFQNQNVAKWRVGNVYNAGANSFNIENAGLSTNAISISSTTNTATFGTNIIASGWIQTGTNTSASGGGLSMAIGNGTNTYTGQSNSISIYAPTNQQLFFVYGNGTSNKLVALVGNPADGNQSYYNWPGALSGTLALTSDLSSYLPLAGGTLTGALTGTTALFNTSAQIGGSSYNLAKLNVQGLQGTYLLDLTNGTEGNFKLRVYNNGSASAPGLVFKQGMFFDEVENGLIKYYRGTFGYDGYIALATGGVDRLNISYAGYVGIGNTNTTYNLDITGTLRTSGSSYFATSSGSVGIGNVSPSYTLDVTGTGRFTGAATFGSTLDTAGNITSTVGAANTSFKLIRTGNTFECVVQDNQSRIRTFGASGNDKDLLFDTDNAGTTRMCIKSTGSVLIGTTTDNGNTLQVNGNISTGTKAVFGDCIYNLSTLNRAVFLAASTTGDIFLFRNNAGGVLGNNSLSGILCVTTVGALTGANASEYVYSIMSAGSGTVVATLTTIGSQLRGTNPISSIFLADDGSGGAVKVRATTVAGLSGAYFNVTFYGVAV